MAATASLSEGLPRLVQKTRNFLEKNHARKKPGSGHADLPQGLILLTVSQI